MYRRTSGSLEVLLVHPGGPFWAKKDAGAWSLPKGEFSAQEDPLDAARREFTEETGLAPEEPYMALAALRQPSGKTILAWAFEGDCDPEQVESNTFSMEWPPRSGRYQEFPEVDRAAWFPVAVARDRILQGQRGFIDELEQIAEEWQVQKKLPREDR
jgi:predicted NUDIX family NTP pyrophosphohydrolase